MTTLGNGAFGYCTSLTSIEIPNSVTTIGDAAFYGCTSLTSIEIPNSVTTIGGLAFERCVSLKNMYCYAENIPATTSDVFDNSSISSATLHVPQSLIDEYRTTAPWSEFGTIVAIEEISQKGDMDGDGNITVADITQLIEIYLNESNGINEIADLDGDGSITVSDITQLIEKYLNPEGENEIPVKSIILSVPALEMAKGESEQMSATVSPTDATNPALQWSSSNTSVATVVDGLVTAIGEGTAIITCAATDGSGVEATCKVTVTTPPTTGTHNGHEWVDLGLSVKWATMNIGAYSPEDYGDYFAWGETKPKKDYSWGTYKWCNGSENSLTKYCTDSKYGTIDNKVTLEPEDDVIHVNWGGIWRMPTGEELDELQTKCTWTWTTINGLSGFKVISKTNGESIFLPAGGYWEGGSFYLTNRMVLYWSSTLDTSNSNNAYSYWSFENAVNTYNNMRYVGMSVRAVCP